MATTRIQRRPNTATDNRRAWEKLLEQLNQNEEVVRQGGGAESVARQHSKQRLTARERIATLCDPGTDFRELALFAAWKMYDEFGGAPTPR